MSEYNPQSKRTDEEALDVVRQLAEMCGVPFRVSIDTICAAAVERIAVLEADNAELKAEWMKALRKIKALEQTDE